MAREYSPWAIFEGNDKYRKAIQMDMVEKK